MQNASIVLLLRMIMAVTAMDVTAGNIADVSTPGHEALNLRGSAWIDQICAVQIPAGGDTLN